MLTYVCLWTVGGSQNTLTEPQIDTGGDANKAPAPQRIRIQKLATVLQLF